MTRYHARSEIRPRRANSRLSGGEAALVHSNRFHVASLAVYGPIVRHRTDSQTGCGLDLARYANRDGFHKFRLTSPGGLSGPIPTIGSSQSQRSECVSLIVFTDCVCSSPAMFLKSSRVTDGIPSPATILLLQDPSRVMICFSV